MGVKKSKLKFKKKINASLGRFFGRFFLIAVAILLPIIILNVALAQYAAPAPSLPTFIPPPPVSRTDSTLDIPEPLPAPKILSPKNGGFVSENKVTLRWTAEQGASSYSIEMGFRAPDTTDFVTSGVPVGTSPTTSYEYDLTGIADGTRIQWAVSGWDLPQSHRGATISEMSEFVYSKNGTKDTTQAKSQKKLNKKRKMKQKNYSQAQQIQNSQEQVVRRQQTPVDAIDQYLTFDKPGGDFTDIKSSYMLPNNALAGGSFTPVGTNFPQINISVSPTRFFDLMADGGGKQSEGSVINNSKAIINGIEWVHTTETIKNIINTDNYNVIRNDKLYSIQFSAYEVDPIVSKSANREFKKMMQSVKLK